MSSSTIEWTEHTWNPTTGCSKVSPGCAHCYAETVALRFWKSQYPPIPLPTGDPSDPLNVRPRAFTDVMCHDDRLDQPLRRKKPTTYFVNSMSDLFHEDVPDDFLDRVFAVMALARRHTFQVLTKRADRMHAYFAGEAFERVAELAMSYQYAGNCEDEVEFDARDAHENMGAFWPLPNVWLGVSVENQHFADERIPLLLQTHAAVRFISAEPLLGPVDLTGDPDPCRTWLRSGFRSARGVLTDKWQPSLDWVIVGGESGPGARPCHVEWIRAIVRQCRDAGTPVFVKQMGSVPYVRANRIRHWEWRDIKRDADKRFTEAPDDALGWLVHLASSKGGDITEWAADLRVREFPMVSQ